MTSAKPYFIMESIICAFTGIIMYTAPHIYANAIMVNDSDGVHWHMTRVTGAVLLGQALTTWKWSSSVNLVELYPPMALGRIMSIVLCVGSALNDVVPTTGVFSKRVLYSALIFCVIWSVIHLIGLFTVGFRFGTRLYDAKGQFAFNLLIQLDSMMAILIGALWVAFPFLILKNQVDFKLNSTHAFISRCFGSFLLATHIYSSHALYFKDSDDRTKWGLGRSLICLAILGGQIYSQFAYGQHWGRGHWIGTSAFSIWTVVAVFGSVQQNRKKFQ